MSPELFYPENFGLTDSHPTKRSDCYALGMVIYEVLSGRVTFPRHNTCAVVAKVSRGERPGQPRGAERKWFTDDVWMMLQRCWAPKRDHRPKTEDVLRCLEEASRFWTPLPPRKVVDPSTTNSFTQGSSEPTTEGSTEDSGTSFPSHVATPEGPPELSSFARLFGKYAKIPARGSTGHDVEEGAVGAGDELVDGPSGRVDSASHSSLSDWDGPILFACPTSATNDSNADISFEADETTNVNIRTLTSAPTLTFPGPPPSHKYTVTELPSRTYYPSAPPKPTSIIAPATSKQRGGRRFRSRAHTQPNSPQRDSLLQSRPVKPLASLSTVVEPPSSSHEYNTDTSTIGPAVPPKPARMLTPVISRQRRVRKSPHNSLPRDNTQSTSPWQSDLSLQTVPSRSLTLLSTFIEPPSSSYGYDTPLQTPHAKSLALSSTLTEPPSSPLQYDTDSSSSSCYPIILPKPANIPASMMSKQRGGVRPLLRSILRDHTQPTSPWRSNLLPQPLPAKSLAPSSTAVEPPSSYHKYNTDSSPSNYYFAVPPMPIGVPTDRAIPKQGGRKSRRSGPPRNRTLLPFPWRSPRSRRRNTSTISSFLPSPEPQVLSMDNVAEAVSYGNMRELSTSRAHRRRFGNRTWKSWLRSSLGKLFGNSATPS